MKKIIAISGFSLIEAVIFIVVSSLAISGIFLAFTTVQQQPQANMQLIATELAQGRMELILGQRRLNGFNTFSDPCLRDPLPSACAISPALQNYSISSNITTTTMNGDSNYKTITVTATGPQGTKATLTTLVANY